MPHLSKLTVPSLFSSALLLGACTYTAPATSHGQYQKNCTTYHTTQCTAHPKPVYTTPHKTYVAPKPHYKPHPKPVYKPMPYHAPKPHYSSVYNKHTTSYHGGGHYKSSYNRTTHHGAPHHGHAAYGGGHPHGLRGAFQPYKYGSLGGVLYDVGAGNLGAQARLGYQFTPKLAAEVEGSLGLVNDKSTVGLVTNETDIGTSFAGFGVYRHPISEKINLLGRVGYHVTDIENSQTILGVTTTTGGSESGLAFGGGAELKLNERDALRLDYTNYAVPGSNLDALSLGYQRKF